MDNVVELKPANLGCDNCFYDRHVFVGSKGPRDAKIVFIAESPGPIELAKREAFVGPGADLLFQNLPEGVDIDSVLFMYAHSCFPKRVKDTKKNTTNTQSAVKRCRGRLKFLLNEYPRDVILTFGNGAIWAATDDHDIRITKDRGRLHTSEFASKGVIGTYHPMFLMRGGGSLDRFREDIAYAFSLADGGGMKKPIVPEWEVARSVDDIHRFNAEMLEQTSVWGDECGADIETAGFDFRNDRILCCGFSVDPHMVYIIPEKLMAHAGIILGGNKLRFVWQNGKFDAKFLHLNNLPGVVHEDTMLMNYSMNEKRGYHDLEQIAADLIGAPSYKDMVKPYITDKHPDGTKKSYADIPPSILYKYLAFDVSNTRQIFTVLKRRLEKDPLSKKLYYEILLKASKLLETVEKNGILVSVEQQKENVKWYASEMVPLEAEMNEWSNRLTGKDINPRSPKQLKPFLYQVLKLGNMGMSTDADTLERLPQHAFVKALRAYRKVQKAYGTFVKKLLLQRLDDGRVHSTFLLHGTGTGRLASKEPNVQNQLRLARIRNQFVAGDGNVIMELDLDQAELRCLATLSGDTELCRIYETDGMSLHKEVSISLWGEDWTRRYAIDVPGDPEYDQAKEEYMRTKALNFGIVYGREAPSIAEEFGVPTHEAQRWIDGWATRFPKAWEYIEKCRMAPLYGQNLKTPFGRRKRVGVVSREKLKDLQNEAANFPHQSIASDITLLAAIALQDWIERNNLTEYVKIINLIHDAILIQCKDLPEYTEPVKYKTKLIMEQVPVDWGITRIPFSADAKRGQGWGDLHDTPINTELDLKDYGLIH